MPSIDQILPAITAVPNAIGDSVSQFLANLANSGRYDEARALNSAYGDRNEALAAGNAAALGAAGQNYLDYTRGYMSDASGASANAFGQRLRTGMSMLEGAGRQQTRDINQQFDSTLGAVNSNLTSRGLSGTSIAPGMRSGVARQRADALGGLRERLLQQRLATYGQLSGDAASAADAWRSNTYNATGGAMQYATNQGQRGYADLRDTIGATQTNRLNLTAGRNDVWQPTPPGLYSQAGAATVGAPSPPSTSGSFWGPVTGNAITGGTTVAAATIIAVGFCVDGETMLEALAVPRGDQAWLGRQIVCDEKGQPCIPFTTPRHLPIRRIRPGDWIACGSPKLFRRVSWVGCCPVKYHQSPADSRLYQLLVTADGAMLRATTDHLVDGRPMAAWMPGDSMGGGRMVSTTTRSRTFDGYDLIVEGAPSYWGNGFDVTSMITAEGATAEEMARRQADFEEKVAGR